MASVITQTSTPHGLFFYAVVVPVGWMHEDAWPAVKSIVKKVYHAAIDVLFNVTREMLSYPGSGLSETAKSFICISRCMREAYGFPKQLVHPLLREVGSYVKSGGNESLKAMGFTIQVSGECLGLVFSQFIFPLMREGCSYLYTGSVEICHYGREFFAKSSETIDISVYLVSPIAEEVFQYCSSGLYQTKNGIYHASTAGTEFLKMPIEALRGIEHEFVSYLYSGSQQLLQGIVFGGKLLVESGRACKELEMSVAQEINSYAFSTISEIGKSGPFLFDCFKELAAVSENSPIRLSLVETGSYVYSGTTEFIKFIGYTAPMILQEGFVCLRYGTIVTLQTLGSYAGSGVAESLKSAVHISYCAAETLEMPYLVSLQVLNEVGSYAWSGCSELTKGSASAIIATKEGTYYPRKLIKLCIEEIFSNASSGIDECVKGIHMGISSIDESMIVPREVVVSAIIEIHSYLLSGFAETEQGWNQMIMAIHESTRLPKEILSAIIDELESYPFTAQNELQMGYSFVAEEIPTEISHGIIDPIEDKLRPTIIEYKRWRRS